MTATRRRAAVALALAALSLPAVAAEDTPAVRQDCSVCNDPTFPQIDSPAPAFVLRQNGSETEPTPFDATQAEVREPAPAVVLRREPGDGPPAMQNDPTWPQTATTAPALHPESDRSEGRVARAKKQERR